MPEHIHLVIARHTFKVEYIAGLLKGEATKQLKSDGLHPLANAVEDGQALPTPWASKCWRVFLDSGDALKRAQATLTREQRPARTVGTVAARWARG